MTTLRLEAHTTPAGKLAIKATEGDLTARKYAAGGYPYYLVRVHRYPNTWNPRTKGFDPHPSLDIRVLKRSWSYSVIEREYRLRGDDRTFVISPRVVPDEAAIVTPRERNPA